MSVPQSVSLEISIHYPALSETSKRHGAIVDVSSVHKQIRCVTDRSSVVAFESMWRHLRSL